MVQYMNMTRSTPSLGKTLCRLCLIAGVFVSLVSTACGEPLSSGIALCADPDGDPRWNAFGQDCATVGLDWPDDAVSAEVVVSNLLTGAARSVVCADRSAAVQLDVLTESKRETVYRLTAAFSFANNRRDWRTTDCVAVRGFNGSALRFIADEPGTAAWQDAPRSFVVPTYAVTDVVTRDGETLPSFGLWRGMASVPLGDTQMALNGSVRTLSRNKGMQLILR